MAANQGGGNLSEVYQSARKLLLRARDGIEHLERLESSVSGGGELSFTVKIDISQIHSLCSDMDGLCRSIAAKSQRDLWKRVHRKTWDVLNILGLSNSALRRIERRNCIDNWIKYALMVSIIIIILYFFWKWSR